MATFTGTDASDTMNDGYISSGAVADPDGATPGSDADVLYGNGADDTLNGSGGDNSIYGGAGNDLVLGGDGNDLLDDDTATSFGGNNSMDGGSGADTLHGRDGNDTLLGGADADFIYGEDGADILNGGPGADTMNGGAGGDTYYVDDAGDTLVEAAGGGTDTVVTSIGWTLGDEFENLRLDEDDIAAYGNDLNNVMDVNWHSGVLYGLDGNDSLYGAYADWAPSTLVGGTGDDYYVRSLNYGDITVIRELPNYSGASQ